MAQDPMAPATGISQPATVLRRLLGGMPIFTLFMTVPQILTIWVGHQAVGVSVLSWARICCLRFFGSGSDCSKVTRTSPCRA